MTSRIPPPSFPVENQKKRLGVFLDNKRVQEAFDEHLSKIIPHETSGGGMTPPPKNLCFLWRPNNYRLKIPFLKGGGGKQEMEVGVLKLRGSFPVETDRNSGVVSVRVRKGLTLQVGKSCVVVMYSLRDSAGRKLWWRVEADDLGSFDAWVDGKVREIYEECVGAVRSLGAGLDFGGCVWIRHEDAVKGEEFLDSLPVDLVLHDSYCKKVYEKEVEFTSPFYMKNFIANRSIERVSPEIARELLELRKGAEEVRLLVERRVDMLGFLKARIGCLGDLARFEGEIRGLSLVEREDLSDWLFCLQKN